MTKVRIIYHADKTVAIIHPAPKSRREDETETQWLERIFDKATPKGIEYDDIDESELPQTREDRDAWEGKKGNDITVNQTKADSIRNLKIRDDLIAEKMKSIAIDELEKEGKL